MIIYIFFFKYVHLKCVLLESLECKYFSVHIPIFYKFAFHSFFFVNCLMVFFVSFFFFYKMHCFKWRRLKVANNYVLGL